MSASERSAANGGNRIKHKIEERSSVVIRFAGDSGDGMQLTGQQFTSTTALAGNDLATLPDFPAEIRAPAGTLPGVSAFQVHFSSADIMTPGDEPEVLVAMNPAALKVNLVDLPPGGMVIVNTDAFDKGNLQKAGYETNPLEDGSLKGYRVVEVPLTTLTLRAVEETGLSNKQAVRCKNFLALGICYWLYDRPLEPTLEWIRTKFAKNPTIVEANTKALQAGVNYANTVELFTTHYRVEKAKLPPGTYRRISGSEAMSLGFVAASVLAERPLFYGSYPITPASDILHELARYKRFGIQTFQAEDEISAVGSAIGAAYAGNLALTGTSGPGLALKGEALGLAVMTELPLVIVNVQRAGPSTGMPTKTEQSDLLQAMFGRNADCPVAVLAPATPSECFRMAIEAFRIAVQHMLPVILLSDGYLANGAEPWRIPRVEDLPRFKPHFVPPNGNGEIQFHPYERDPDTLARPWAVPGTEGLEHRIGGLEKEDVTGNVCYEPDNHWVMTQLRHQKVERVAEDVPDVQVNGTPEGKLLVVGWGSTYGAITAAVDAARAKGSSVSSIHLRYVNPFPKNLGEVLGRFERVLVPELNMGQLRMILRARFLVDAEGLSKVMGKPFRISEILTAIENVLAGRPAAEPAPVGAGRKEGA
jgi:2-oxoglutarate ferredoxin oxidoreductase subunit alpha